MDADVIGIPSAERATKSVSAPLGLNDGEGQAVLREVGDGQEWILVEHVALEEPLQQVPRHWSLLPGRAQEVWRARVGRTTRTRIAGEHAEVLEVLEVSEARRLTRSRH